MSERLKILHLAFEDHEQPGSGGGAVRTREINSRLAERHDIDVITGGWRGCRTREEPANLTWKHTMHLPGRARAVGYYATLPAILARSNHDLVIEDFAPPTSTIAVPRMTRKPVVGVVQYLFAGHKTKQYHLPLDRVESWGLRQHTDLIAVSHGLADELHERAPQARVTVVENGMDRDLFVPPVTALEPAEPVVLFLGRLERAQKGLDLLLRAAAELRTTETFTLVIAGDGPDREAIQREAAALGLTGVVDFVGQVRGERKKQLLYAATAVVVPSRYETFGMVAVEAMAAGSAVVGSDIPCLRDVIGSDRGVLVPTEDSGALASAIRRLLSGPGPSAEARAAARQFAHKFDWDELALEQEKAYLEALFRFRSRGTASARG